MKTLVSLIILSVLCFPVTAQMEEESVRAELDRELSQLLTASPDAPVANVLCYLEVAPEDFVFHKGYGALASETEIPVQKDHGFKTASISKMFTATIVLQLMEEGKIDLDKTVESYLYDFDFIDFDRLLLVGDESFGKEITIGQLLKHRSGLADIFTDTEAAFIAGVMEDPSKSWSPELLFEKYYALGVNELGKFRPGKDYAYSDVNYFLLGLLIENITGESLAENYRNRILNPLGMHQTFFEYYEPATELVQSHAYMGGLDVTANINTSFDWAGGGLVSTTGELAVFIQGLFNGKLFKDQATLEMMTDDPNYGYGISNFDIEGEEYFGHSGHWGSAVLYNPEKKITLCLSVNQVETGFSFSEVIKNLIDLAEKVQ
ncbi:serine hydrolase domain-containing protein [Robertkochia aurantiaca]|uniref:serine hydrolase domain-containing protein n=1 Tax=Robertkochia aurantiaca TaxID=2873700 RepID=UPI001CCFA67A|nr:serine hydrolase domain-containing protein [Robertkochia sp. 3YJGBD-33]